MMNIVYSFGRFSFLAILLAAFGCQPAEKTSKTSMKFIDPANFDTTVRAQDDFFQYANGGWLAANEIPSDKSSWGSFNILFEKNRDNLKAIIDEVAADETAEAGSNRQKVRDFYLSGMDTASIESLGFEPIRANLDKIDQIQTIDDIQRVGAFLQTQTIGNMFGAYVGQDEKDVESYILNFYQGGISLPERDYYFRDDERSKKIQEAYKAYIAKGFQLTGTDEVLAVDAANRVYALEKTLAEKSRTRVALRDPEANYNKYAFSDLSKLGNNLNWNLMFQEAGVPAQEFVIVGQPEFFEGLNTALEAIPMDDWKWYLKFKVIHEAAPFLSSDFEQAQFDFYSTELRGVSEMEPRWKRVQGMVGGQIRDALGQLYVEKYFPPEAKKVADEMIEDIKAALGERIDNLAWMSQETKTKAREKLGTFVDKIGYPDKWKDYSSVEIVAGDYYGNIRRSSVFSYKENIDKLGSPMDRDEWFMSPAIVNAYYNPTMNEIVFPAGILQFPFFDFEADPSINYGGIGAVIGHEITHGFDDQGSQFAADGTLSMWWTEEDREKFEARTQVVVDQYNSFRVFDTMPINGELTLGENIADIGGLSIAYDALQKNFERNGRPDDIDGMTPEQRFFLSFAQVWRMKFTDKALEQRVKTDVHSPAMFRVNGVLPNIDAFYQAFDVKEGDGMYMAPEARAAIW